MRNLAAVAVAVGLSSCLPSSVFANVLNMGGTRNVDGSWTGLASLEFVSVGDAGNVADTTRYGAVGYTYQMGKYDVTAAQYCQFLNAVASISDPYGLYNQDMANPSNYGCGITREGNAGGYSYSVTRNPDFPVNYVSWGDAARFSNWLGNGQPTGVQGSGTTETGSYTLNGLTTDASLMAVARNAGAKYVIPSEDEWYKAAYYKGGSANAGYWDYPTRSDSLPSNVLSSTGTNNANYLTDTYPNRVFTDPTNLFTTVGAFAASPSPYGTFDQGGDVWQWNEAIIVAAHTPYRGMRGGAFNSSEEGMQASCRPWGYAGPAVWSNYNVGFRVALVPEPATLSLLSLGGLLLARRRRA